MEERNNVIPIFKSNDQEKILVFHAASLQNEIRFYLNDTQYFTAVDCEEGFEIRFRRSKNRRMWQKNQNFHN